MSPDGEVVAFEGSDDRIWRVGVDGSEERPLTPMGVQGYGPVWSPDGDRILFDGAFGGPGELKIVEADGSRVRTLLETSADEVGYAWSENGDEIVFARTTRSGWTLHAIDTDGENERMLGAIRADPENSDPPVWSSDRGRVLWITVLADPGSDPLPFGNAEIFVANADGSEQRNLTQHEGWDNSASWSPDGDEIAFVTDRSGVEELWVMSADGTDLRRLTRGQDVSIDSEPAWAPDGSAVAFGGVTSSSVWAPPWTIRADGSELRRLVKGDETMVEELAWSTASG
jgi:TolB protein